jgi:hypothetical protein
MIGIGESPDGCVNSMKWSLRTIHGKGSLANLMPLIGFHYKRCLLIDEIFISPDGTPGVMNGVASM